MWTENPRDPIDENALDQDIVDRAISDDGNKWRLSFLAKNMGQFYDLSELPTVVYKSGKPVVYDGNRRMILAKIQHELVTVENLDFDIPLIPRRIPCNVCSEEIALQNVLRKHGGSGSWSPLERDIFLHKHLKRPKSVFLIFDEQTQLISKNPLLNRGFVKKEILQEGKLQTFGFQVNENEELLTSHDNREALLVLNNIVDTINDGTVSTRKNRGNILESLDIDVQKIIEKNARKKPHLTKIDFSTAAQAGKIQRRTRRTKKRDSELFNGRLYLKSGDVNNLYADILTLHDFYSGKKEELSPTFPSLIRMSLRLLCETASGGGKKGIDRYVQANFSKAKATLDQNTKTTLHMLNITETSLVTKLHVGAHNYSAANNMEETLGVSLILGAMLTISHGR